MTRDIIHIGYHKTATNWFQRIFYPYVRNFRYLHRKRAREAFLQHSAFHFDPLRARETIGKEDDSGIILCEEELSGNLHNGGLLGCFSKEIAERIREALPDAQIVIFIRSQPVMIASAYKQYVKEGGTYGVSRYLHHHRHLHQSGFQPAKTPFFSFDHFEYLPLIQHYQKLFGADRVHIYPYEAFSSDLNGFMDCYIKNLGLDIELSAIPEQRVNIGYRSGTLRVARFLNHFTYRDVADKRYWINIPFTYRKSRILLKHLNRLPLLGRQRPARELLGPENTAFIHSRYADTNYRLMQELGLPLDRYGYPLPGPGTNSAL